LFDTDAVVPVVVEERKAPPRKSSMLHLPGTTGSPVRPRKKSVAFQPSHEIQITEEVDVAKKSHGRDSADGVRENDLHEEEDSSEFTSWWS
jgi:hypothetical protein